VWYARFAAIPLASLVAFVAWRTESLSAERKKQFLQVARICAASGLVVALAHDVQLTRQWLGGLAFFDSLPRNKAACETWQSPWLPMYLLTNGIDPGRLPYFTILRGQSHRVHRVEYTVINLSGAVSKDYCHERFNGKMNLVFDWIPYQQPTFFDFTEVLEAPAAGL
jgi:hypothetical protein